MAQRPLTLTPAVQTCGGAYSQLRGEFWMRCSGYARLARRMLPVYASVSQRVSHASCMTHACLASAGKWSARLVVLPAANSQTRS